MSRKKRKNVPGQGTPRTLTFEGYMPTDETFDILYQRYSKQYDAVKGKLKRGESMYITKYSKVEFKEYYTSKLNEAEKDGTIPENQSKADVANGLIQDIVEDSRYEYTNKQARWYRKGLKSLNKDYNFDIDEIRSGYASREIDELKAELERLNEQYKSEGKDSFAIRRIIGIDFFGSPD